MNLVVSKAKNSSFSEARQEANHEFLVRRSKRLKENRAAIAALASLRIVEQTLKKFCLGLSEQYVDSKRIVHENALIAPIINNEGKPTNQSIYFNLPKVTVNPVSNIYWARGDSQTYYSEAYKNQSSVFVCADLIELWHLSQLVSDKWGRTDILFILSSKNKTFPKEWLNSDFWSRFEKIYIGYKNDLSGDKTAVKVAKLAGQNSRRVKLPERIAANWAEYCERAGNTFEAFDQFLDEAKPFGAKLNSGSNDIFSGRSGYQPVDIAGTFHNGHLYYPTKTIIGDKDNYSDEFGNPVSQVSARVEVVLVKSNRRVETVCEVPAPRGTPLSERILKLTDGTLIKSRPKASSHSTWSWQSIENYHSGKKSSRPLGKILNDVKLFLKQSVWLPLEHDYDLLTLLVPVTYAQAIFRSVPLVLITGPSGSGKTTLGKAMVKICADAIAVRQLSPSAITGLINENTGFVFLDDLGNINGAKRQDAAQFIELMQSLKFSYNRETGWKTSDVIRGIKMLNHITGINHMVGSGVLQIYTRNIPIHLNSLLGTRESLALIELSKLRDELHTWIFENVCAIDETYRALLPILSDGESDIFMPLHAFAELAGDDNLRNGLTKSLEFQHTCFNDSIDPIALMKESVKRMIIDGQTVVSPSQVVLDIEKLASGNPAVNFEEDTKWRSPAWIGRQLRINNIIAVDAQPARQFHSGKFLRMYPLEKIYISKILSGTPL